MGKLFREEESIFSIQVDDTAKAYLLETARWTRFLAIFLMIGTALFLLLGIGTVVIMSQAGDANWAAAGFGPGALAAFYIVFVANYVYPIWALYKFSGTMKEALHTGNQVLFNESLAYQKNMFRFLGVLTLVVLAMYGISLLLWIAGSLIF